MKLAITFHNESRAVLRKRGRVRGIWVAWPVAICLLISMVVAFVVEYRTRPDSAYAYVGLYLSVAFFAHAYSVAWKAGSFVWRYSLLVLCIAFLGLAGWLHVEDANARIIYVHGSRIDRAAEPVLIACVFANILASALLLLHGFLLGTGSREPLANEIAAQLMRLARSTGEAPAKILNEMAEQSPVRIAVTRVMKAARIELPEPEAETDEGSPDEAETDEAETDEAETDEAEAAASETDEAATDEAETDEAETDEAETDAAGPADKNA